MPEPVRAEDFRADDLEIQKNPYPFYPALREDKPVLRSDIGGRPVWIVSRRADILKILMDTATYSSATIPVPNMLSADPPEHERLRKMVAAFFTREAVSSMASRIQANASELIEEPLQRGFCDLINDFAGPLTVAMIAQMLGIPVAQLERIRGLTKRSADFVLALQLGRPPAPEAKAAREELLGLILDIVKSGDFEQGAVMSILAEIYAKGELTEDQVVSFVLLLLIAGHSTTTNLIGNSVYMLAQRPADLEHMAADPAFIQPFVEEVLRTRPSFHRIGRITTRDVELHGEFIPKGSLLRLLLASANRDPAAFGDNAEEFDPEAKRRLHMAFGQGIHSCLGSWLARLEATTTLGVISRAVGSIALDPARAPIGLSGGTLNDFGFESLPILLRRRNPSQ